MCLGSPHSPLPVGARAQGGVQDADEASGPVKETEMCQEHHFLCCKEIGHMAAA